MSWLSGHKKVRIILQGMAENCIHLMRCRNAPELQVRQKHSFLGLQTLKPNSYHHTIEFTTDMPIRNYWSAGQYPYMLGSIRNIKEYLYGSSQYETLWIRAQSWNQCKICEFSTQKFEQSVPQFRQSTRGPTFQKIAIHQAGGDKSQATLLYLVALVVAMVGSTYAAVPLYRKFCQATGYGGTVQRRETAEEKIARHAQEGTDTSRELVVQFNADVADGMPWRFIPSQREVRVKPGDSALAFYTAENLSSKPITGVSTYNVTPMKVAIYFNKIQCFCFEEQRLLPGEKIDMPVFFYVDPEFATDPKMDGINNMILSYTFFKVEDEQP